MGGAGLSGGNGPGNGGDGRAGRIRDGAGSGRSGSGRAGRIRGGGGDCGSLGTAGAAGPGAAGGSGLTAAAGQPPPPGAAEIAAGLPVPRVDPADPAAGYLATLGTLEPAQLTAVLSAAVAGQQGTPAAVAESPETLLALARARIVTGDLPAAWDALARMEAGDDGDWRTTWYLALAELVAGNPGRAAERFGAVCDELPGELAPKLALGFAAEAAGDLASATRYFRLVWTVDRSFVSAAFGLARTRLRTGDQAGAIAALTAVPQTSSLFWRRRSRPCGSGCRRTPASPASRSGDLAEAGRELSRLILDPRPRSR